MLLSGPTRSLVGRDLERSLIDDRLSRARTGDGSSVVIVGEPGSGKTTLASAATERAEGFLVITCRGVEWEAELPFSGLHELLMPVLDDLGALPEPQRDALEGALGLSAVVSAHTLSVYAGALTLILEATRRRPVLLIVEDLQWIDSSTAQVLAFVARRIAGEPVFVLATARPGTELDGLPDASLLLTPLDTEAVGELAAIHLGGPLPPASVADLAAATGGNPLAIVETVRAFGAELALRGSPLDEPLPVGALIEQRFADRLGALSQDARRSLEVVAACVTDDAATVMPALGRLEIPVDGLIEAERAGAVRLHEGRVHFAHPLLRALVHRQTPPERLRRCFGALATTTGDDLGLSAWYAASAAVQPDETVAATLDAAAEVFAARGGNLASSQALARAAALTPEADARARRMLRAGRAAHLAGRGLWAVDLLKGAVDTARDPALQAMATYRLRCLEAHVVGVQDLSALHLQAANDAEGLDEDLVVEALASAGVDAIVSGSHKHAVEAKDRLLARRAAGTIPDDLAEDVDATIGVILVVLGEDGPEGLGAELLRGTGTRRLELDLADNAYVVEALVWIEAFDLARALCDRIIPQAQQQGDAFILAGGLWADGCLRSRVGDWSGARRQFVEAIRVIEATAQVGQVAVMRASLAIIQACQGDDALVAAVPEIEELGRAHEFGVLEEYIGTALGLAELGAGRASAAVEHFGRARRWKDAAGQLDPCVCTWPFDLVEAHLMAGDPDAATEALERVRAIVLRSRRPGATAAVARLDGMLADEASYEAHFLESLALYEATTIPFERARTQLAYGRRLRRSRRRRDARVQLTAALAEFDRLGAEPWSAQARREMGATTPTAAPAHEQDGSELTGQERRVAELVAGGASNKEVAGAMFLSPKTIETHLSRIYRKVGVASRTQLAAVIGANLDDRA